MDPPDDIAGESGRPRGRPRDPRVDRAIVRETLREVAEYGFTGASLERVALRAGVSKTAIYRRWGTREALLDHVASELPVSPAMVDTGDLRRDLIWLARSVADDLRSEPVRSVLPQLIAESSRNDGMRHILRNLVAERRVGAIAAVQDAVARQTLSHDVDPEFVVDALLGLLVFRALVLGEPVDACEVGSIIDVVLADAGASFPSRSVSHRLQGLRGENARASPDDLSTGAATRTESAESGRDSAQPGEF